eukprot:TRINITY_DN923_c0_g1_i10.p1 TRINITY_DN923_c0_g1~~TRINITY_DN923_c0_g1_i10.p1  ORF type:complete len:593 (+),score=99.63 TRINITY_DN923_c0_g1_i10:49-1779(+)
MPAGAVREGGAFARGYSGGTVVASSGEADLNLGCGGAANLCFEPDGAAATENWAYVGNGRGQYQIVESLQYVGQGGSYDRERVVTYSGWRCRLWCIFLLVLLLLAGIGILVWLILPKTDTGKEEVVKVASTSEPFDCEAGYWNWEKGWSIAKKHWCCDYKSRGCPRVTTSLPFDCDAGLSNWQQGWSISKKQWCCAHQNKGCEVVTVQTSQPYDCQAGLSNWNVGWSRGKQLWCCAKQNLGCPKETTSLPYDCSAGYSNWQAGWSPGKKAWCCQHFNKGCAVSLPYDCNAGFSNWQVGWSAGKKAWCCHHESKGCGHTGSCSLWGDPHIFTFDHSRLVFYSEGDFWVVKSPTISIQGRFQATDWTKKNDNTDYSSMTGVVVGGQFMQGHKIEIGSADMGKITCNGQEILHYFGTVKCGPATLYYNQQGELVDSAMAFLPHKVVHMTLPNNVVMQVNRWPNFINAKITMQQESGQEGICGDFNGVKKAGFQAGKELHAKWGFGVPREDLLFPSAIPLHVPEKLPSSKRCSDEKRQKATQICHVEAAHAAGWSFAECLGDVCDPHTSTAEEMKEAMHQ